MRPDKEPSNVSEPITSQQQNTKSFHWPTAEELREARTKELNPIEALKILRRRIPLGGHRTENLILK